MAGAGIVAGRRTLVTPDQLAASGRSLNNDARNAKGVGKPISTYILYINIDCTLFIIATTKIILLLAVNEDSPKTLVPINMPMGITETGEISWCYNLIQLKM